MRRRGLEVKRKIEKSGSRHDGRVITLMSGKESIDRLVAALMGIKYLEMMLFILVSGVMPSISLSGVMPSISVSSVAANRAFSRSTLLCSLSISTSYWKRRDVALLVTRHRRTGVPLGERSEKQTEKTIR